MLRSLCALALALVSTGVFAAEPQKLWDLAGFETPESVLPVPDQKLAYVSNVAGKPTDKDGNGFISKMSLEGKMIEPRWVTGLDAPKGLALAGGKLYVADIDRLVEIDAGSGKILNRYEASGAKFLNDVAADGKGGVFVSDMTGNAIWRLSEGKFERWLADDALNGPNGLHVSGDKLIVASFGAMGDDGQVKTPGSLFEISLGDKSVRNLGEAKPLGALDGLEPLNETTYLATDWVAGGLYRIDATGQAKLLLDLNQGSADIGYLPADSTVFIPMMKDNTVAAYRVEQPTP